MATGPRGAAVAPPSPKSPPKYPVERERARRDRVGVWLRGGELSVEWREREWEREDEVERE